MDNLLIIAGAACLAIMFTEVLGAPVYLKKWIYGPRSARRIKPFDCEYCMAFWICLATCIYFEKNIPEVIYSSAIAAVVARLLNR